MHKAMLGCGLAFLVFLAAGLFLINIPAYSQEPIARVSSFVGEVFVRSAVTQPAGEWRRLTAAPAPLFNGDEVRTERGRAEVIYPNDDAVRILENSTARFTLSQEPRRRALLFRRVVNLRAVSTTAGKLWANVKADANNEMEFRSPVAVASVRGTILEFFYDAATRVLFTGVADGLVRLLAQGVSVDVGANRAATVAAGQPPSLPFSYTPTPAPAVSETAMAAALDAPPAAPVAAPPVPVAPPPAVAPVAAAPVAAVPSGGGGALAVAPTPTGIAPSTTPAPGAFVWGTFPSLVPSGLDCDDCFIRASDLGFTFSFPFYGTTYSSNSIFVNSNGSITFNSGDDVCCMPNLNRLFRHQVGGNPNESPLGQPRPRIAAFADDLFPPGGGTIDLTQFDNSFVVTFRNVPSWILGINTFRTWLFSNGQIRMEYNNTAVANDRPRIGISPGGHDARLNPVNFSSGNITGLTGAIFQGFFNSVVTGQRLISHANISVPGFPTTTIVANTPFMSVFDSDFASDRYRGTSPVSGNPFTLQVSPLGSFALSYPTPTSPTFRQTGASFFTPNGPLKRRSVVPSASYQ